MILYFGKRFNSALVDTRIVDVTCDKCGCEYQYSLARVGSGTGVAPYMIGERRAAQAAVRRASEELSRRFKEDAEFVPCPKCQWINEELVAGYRRSRHRGWTKLATWLGVGGAFATLVGAYFVSIGPAADRDLAPSILIGGLTISIGVAAAVLLLRFLLRSLIQPNKNYPHAPKLPLGSPAALVRNPVTREVEPVGPVDSCVGDGGWVDFQVGRGVLPPYCCECLAPATPLTGYRRPLRPAVELVVPLCGPCSRRWTGRMWLGALIALGLAPVVGGLILYALQLDEVLYWFTTAAVGVVLACVGGLIADRLVAPVRVRIVDGARGVVRLWFRNESYLNEMCRVGEPSRSHC